MKIYQIKYLFKYLLNTNTIAFVKYLKRFEVQQMK